MTYSNITDLFLQLQEGYNNESLDKVYACLKQGDVVELTMTALEVLKETKTMPKFEKKWKSEKESTVIREEGNKMYVAGKFQVALMCYNQALLHAPNRSNAMLLAYSNRSALFLKTKNYSASIKDIDTCLNLNCNKDILDKLTKRKCDCEQNLWREQCQYGLFPDNYFKLKGKCHPQIPCVSNDVKIVIDPATQLPTVTAAKDIKVGTVVAIDTAFTALLNPINYYLCCYYCHRMSLNLVPCLNCTYALFCDKDCRDRCMKESHSTECYIMELLQGGFCGPYSRISFRTVIKIKQLCSTWKEFNEASYKIGSERMKTSSVNEIYDGNHKFSMLSFVELRDAKDGAKYNFAFMCATFLEHLMNNSPFFFPNNPKKKDEAIRALARMSMNLLLKFYNKIELNNVANDRQSQMMKCIVPNYGYFAFASKLRHDCFANTLPIALNNRVALVALQPIKKGEEVTISYIEHAFNFLHAPRYSVKERVIELYRFARTCACAACSGSRLTTTLSDAQKRQCRRWFTKASDILAQGTDAGFKPSCEMLGALKGLAHTVSDGPTRVPARVDSSCGSNGSTRVRRLRTRVRLPRHAPSPPTLCHRRRHARSGTSVQAKLADLIRVNPLYPEFCIPRIFRFYRFFALFLKLFGFTIIKVRLL